jgi:aspartate/glutamate racemase
MTLVQGGFTNQGQPIGILMLETVFPRIAGDVGNAFTFDFPVRYLTVKGANSRRVVKEADPTLLEPFIDAAQELEQAGCGAITTSCGFLAMFQKEMAAAVDIPVFTSSLMQVPFVNRFLTPKQKIGIMTARAASLTEKHFSGAGIDDQNYAIQGMDEYPEFTNAYIEGKKTMDVEKVQAEMVDAAQKLLKSHPEIGAIVFECTNMPPFSAAVQSAVKLPVFDIVTLTRYIASSLMQKPYAN